MNKGLTYTFTETAVGKVNVVSSEKSYTFKYPCFSTIVCAPYEVKLSPGYYSFELWGAQGGDGRVQNKKEINENSGGKGSYVTGILHIAKTVNMYLYVGGKGENQISIEPGVYSYGGFNGGGIGGIDMVDASYPESCAGGGGSSDIRLKKGTSIEALKSRIIVAAGGGSGTSMDSKGLYGSPLGGHGGDLVAVSFHKFNIGGTQTTGSFGKGDDGFSYGSDVFQSGGSTGGNGGGYYGGISLSASKISAAYLTLGGAGGSSYISGYPGCNSVKELPLNEISHSGSTIHYSGYVFKNSSMKSGATSFISPFGSTTLGNYGNGCIKISIISLINISRQYQIKLSAFSASILMCISLW